MPALFEVVAVPRFDLVRAPRLAERAREGYAGFTRFALSLHDLAIRMWSDGDGRARFGYEVPDGYDLGDELGDAAEFLRLAGPVPVTSCACAGDGSQVYRRMRAVVVGGGTARTALLPEKPEDGVRYRVPIAEPLVAEERSTRWAPTLQRLAEIGGCVHVRFARQWSDEFEQSYSGVSLDALDAMPAARLDPASTGQLRSLAVGAPLVAVTVSTSPSMRGRNGALLRDLPLTPLTVDDAGRQLGLGGSPSVDGHLERRASGFAPEEAGLLAFPPYLRIDTPSRMPSYAATGIPFAMTGGAAGAREVVIGFVLGRPVTVPAVSLTRHMFVTGTTGSGKTTTIGNVTEEVAAFAEPAVPITLIDPLQGRFARVAKAIGAVRIDFASGDQSVRFNPFLPAPQGSAYQHCELVTQALALMFPTNRVAFDLLGSMVRHLYRDRHLKACPECGDEERAWNHFLGVTGEHLLRHRDQIPVIDDLIAISPEFLKTIKGPEEFSTEWFRDTEGHFAQRWEGLRKSALYRVFGGGEPEATRGLTAVRSARRWWNRRILVELGAGFCDDERVTLTLLLFALLCGHYRSEAVERAARGDQDEDLRHLAVIDEAHRLAPAGAVPGGELLSARDALTTFVDQMVAEARADGLGLVFADQSLLAVSDGLIVNTGTKIIQRVVHGGERAAAATSIGLDAEGTSHLARLAEETDRREVVFISPRHPEPTRMEIVERTSPACPAGRDLTP
ncbi:hypothetical protein [Sphaerisporangium dianthi]|uniref:Helicase HerA central domain-containing protein n=1 Tax=Sphaerisporangium dianthi TaxID=1436120 RepID=A0ABV9CCV4_9ACTN